MKPIQHLCICSLLAFTFPLATQAQPNPNLFPEDSDLARAPGQKILVSAVEEGAVKDRGAWRIIETNAGIYADLPPKIGAHALKFSGVVTASSGKGDYGLGVTVPGKVSHLGMWIYLEQDSNVSEVGFQLYDDEGEALMAMIPVSTSNSTSGSGWQWVETTINPEDIKQAYDQAEKNGVVDFPLKGINLVWFAGNPGPTYLGVDCFVAATELESSDKSLTVDPLTASWGEPGQPFQPSFLVHNYTDTAQSIELNVSLQANPQLVSPELPHPELGSDHAEGKKGWFIKDGQETPDDTLTDGRDDTHLTPWLKDGSTTEFFQIVDLNAPLEVKAVRMRGGDPNWVRLVDVQASSDGKTFSPIPGLTDLKLEGEWQPLTFRPDQPTQARYIRIRHHQGGEPLPGYFRTLAFLNVYDGADDETITIPETGKVVDTQTIKATIPPQQFAVVEGTASPALESNAYLFAVSRKQGELTQITLQDYFVMPSGEVTIRPESRFGINVSVVKYIPELTRAGFGWVRFENMKWEFYNPAPGDFRFDGTVAPWNVPMDDYFKTFHAAGMSILPYIFQTPKWASTKPDIENNRYRAYPPKDNADYGKAIFEAVARYGDREVSASQLESKDKKTGLNLIQTYELWNEPNLNAESWGFFVGTLDEYYPLFRAGAEGAKRANPNAVVTNGAWAGLSMEWVDTMRTFKYPDGKTPLDFTDVLNIHYYTGKQEPELATDDPNAKRGTNKTMGGTTLEQQMIAIADWRDELKPEMPIWVTEMGYDVGGPIGSTERTQAAKLARSIMLSFANGFEKVFIFREMGSQPVYHGGAGLLRDDQSLRPSYFTIATLARQLDGVKTTRVPRLQTDDARVWMYYWTRSEDRVLTVWAPDGSAPLGIDLGSCTVVNAFGHEEVRNVGPDFQLGIFPYYISDIKNTSTVLKLEQQAISREKTRKEQKAALEKAKAYLFDFGSTEFIGRKEIGTQRTFIPVLLEDAYSDQKGYGVTANGGGKNISRHWLESPLNKDGLQMFGALTFKFKAEPGTYLFEFQGEHFKQGATLTITGGTPERLTVDLTEGKDSPPTAPVEITVNSQPLEIEFSPGNLHWLSLIEKTSQ
jgi:hypothetical protein